MIGGKPDEWQIQGGTLDIPKGWFISNVDMDAEEPYLIIADETGEEDTIELKIPKPLAYFLTTHFCGSEQMRQHYINQGKRIVREDIKRTLQL